MAVYWIKYDAQVMSVDLPLEKGSAPRHHIQRYGKLKAEDSGDRSLGKKEDGSLARSPRMFLELIREHDFFQVPYMNKGPQEVKKRLLFL